MKDVSCAPELCVEAEDEDAGFKPLTPNEAREWRKRHPLPSVWRLVRWQILVGAAAAVLAGGITQNAASGLSAAYGALCVVLPAMVFARGVTRRHGTARAAMVGFFVWEIAKIALTLAMLWTAPRWLGSVHWLALVITMVITMKTYWVLLLARPGVSTTID